MGVEEPSLADPAVCSGESFSRWVINPNVALSARERTPARRETIEVSQEEGLCAICVCSGRSRLSLEGVVQE